MKIIGKIILLLCLSLVLASCGASRKALTQTSGVQSGFICTGLTGNGDIVVKATATGSGRDAAYDNSVRGAVEALLFTGIEGDQQNRVSFQPSLIGKTAVSEEGRVYFDNFFSQGLYRQYASALPSASPTFVKSGKGYKAVVYLLVKKNDLRKELEKKNILKSMQNMFN